VSRIILMVADSRSLTTLRCWAAGVFLTLIIACRVEGEPSRCAAGARRCVGYGRPLSHGAVGRYDRWPRENTGRLASRRSRQPSARGSPASWQAGPPWRG
jgi:hypothetical protein